MTAAAERRKKYGSARSNGARCGRIEWESDRLRIQVSTSRNEIRKVEIARTFFEKSYAENAVFERVCPGTVKMADTLCELAV